MKAVDIIGYLRARLPDFTDLFNDILTISSLTRSGTTVTAVTTTSHNLVNNDAARIIDALSPNSISSLRIANSAEKTTIIDYLKSKGREYNTLFSMNIVLATTTNNHDLTEVYYSDVVINGAAESEYNGTNRLLRVQNRQNFAYAISGTPATPATGSPILIEDLAFGYNGLQTVTVINATTFTYEITGTPGSPAVGVPIAKVNTRISGAATPERIVRSYTPQSYNKLWAFVILEDVVTSKDRDTLTDTVATRTPGCSYRLRQIYSFSVYIFIPSVDSTSGRPERDLMEDVNVYLSKSILGAIFPTGYDDVTPFMTVPLGYSLFNDSGSFIVYKFDYETTYDITEGDIVDPSDNVTFRDIKLKFRKYFDDDDVEIMATQVDLDDIPL